MNAIKSQALPMRLIDAEGERLIIANLLADEKFCKAVLPQLSFEDFALDMHQRVFSAIISATERGYDPGLGGVYRWPLDAGKRRDDLSLPVLE